MEILTARPKNMPFEFYKEHLHRQRKWLRSRLQGHIVYVSSELIDFDTAAGSFKSIRRYRPFVGNTKTLK